MSAAIRLNSKTIRVNTELLIYWQKEQNVHDAGYHKDVANRMTFGRLAHDSFHFGKYIGRFCKEGTAPSDTARKTVTDAALIALGAANALNINLADEIGKTIPALTQDSVITVLGAANGDLNNYLDKYEHMEKDLPDVHLAVVAIVRWVLAAAHLYDVNLSKAMEERRGQIRDSRTLLGARAIA
ncbi:MAG: hypothetical protein DI585_00465 [Pseudomonas fluorescens]|nr:MAG: hypothetical protein DI585_00465 [Pseudomonas fluorescens]